MRIFSRSTRPPSAPAPSRPATGEARIRQLGGELLAHARQAQGSVLSSAFWSQKLMDWALNDPGFKVQLFRFVDTFPVLRTPEQVYDHLADYMSQPGVKLPTWMDLSLKAGGLGKGILAKTISGQIEAMAAGFIAGRDAASAGPVLERLWRGGTCFSVDLLGEACVSDAEADAYRAKYLDLIETLPKAAAGWPAQPRLERDHLGALPRVNVSIKISSLSARTNPVAPEASIRSLMESLGPVLRAAGKHGVFVNFDMEQEQLKDLTLTLFERCCEAHDFQAGLAMQAYLRSGEADARRIAAWSARTGRVVTVRLVKGAYWDAETIEAEQRSWPTPVWSRKCDSDACYERMTEILLAATPTRAGIGGVKLAVGSHNARSIAAALAAAERAGLPREAIELQMLRGMADTLKAGATAMGLRVREYVPVGEMVPGMGYLVRRLLENTSNESWLKAGFLDNADDDALLASPHAHGAPTAADESLRTAPERHALSEAHPEVGDGRPFWSEPPRDFSKAPVAAAFATAVAEARVPTIDRLGTPEDATRTVDMLHAAFPAWRDRPWQERAAVLVRTAAWMRQRRDQLAAVMVKEAGKTWREADIDTCEAIEFCEYYAREAARLFDRRRLGRFAGELDEEWSQGRGVALAVSPWNFPLAICTGLTVAPLVCGNTVVVKPAEPTPGIAKLLCEGLWASGAPRDVLAFLPGPGRTMGSAIVRDPRVACIAFTGSKAVGLEILRTAGEVLPGQAATKRVVCEMGGKNAVIVDASADLDEAVLGVRQSAFGYCGQKCSACSRVVVVDSAFDAFLHRLVESTKCLVVGDPADPATDMGPVIDAKAAKGIRVAIEVARGEGRMELEMQVPAGLEERIGKPFIAPVIVSGIRREHRTAREEIFGPVLAVMRAKDFDEAIEIANDCEYRLTGGLFSRMPKHIEAARRRVQVGNLYINRTTTGALVGRQPFGGFGMSGAGAKAGGRHYLAQFVDSRICCENTMRRGFAPESC